MSAIRARIIGIGRAGFGNYDWRPNQLTPLRRPHYLQWRREAKSLLRASCTERRMCQ